MNGSVLWGWLRLEWVVRDIILVHEKVFREHIMLRLLLVLLFQLFLVLDMPYVELHRAARYYPETQSNQTKKKFITILC